MPTYIVTTETRSITVEDAAEAIREAAKDVYLDAHRQREHVERLEKTGRTAWAYGFSTAVIELRKTEDSPATPEEVEAAIARHGNGQDISFDDEPAASRTDHGVWVSAWAFVSNSDIEGEKEDGLS